jgi:DNA-binding CsgD family transcriptional regulator
MEDKYIIGSGVADDLAQAMRQLAAQLGISLQTVKHHLTSIFDKIGMSSRLELALFAIRNGLVGRSD